MSLRGKAAIVGIGEIPSRRSMTGVTAMSLMAEAAVLALEDAHLTKADVDGIITNAHTASPMAMAGYLQIQPVFSEGTSLHGASGAQSIAIAASAIMAGLCETVLCVLGGARDAFGGGPSVASEWEAPFGPGAATTGNYALIKRRHMHEFGSRDEQFAKMAVNQRFNALKNPNAVFQGQPLTLGDVLNSRYASEPIHLLETVMPCYGAAAAIVTSAERARTLTSRPAYLLGAGAGAISHEQIWQDPGHTMTTSAVTVTAKRAFQMAGYGPQDMQSAQFYD
jgi:acetyl-CoA acetyltransferase